MAEERLIDDDLNKDRKYKIRKNADGEDELYYNPDANEDLTGDGVEIVEEFGFDDEEAVDLTAEQYAAREAAAREEAERKKAQLTDALAAAGELVAKGEYDAALAELKKAEEADPGVGEIYSLKLVAATKNFTQFSGLDELGEIGDRIANFCSDEQRTKLKTSAQPLKEYAQKAEEEAAALHVEVEQKKAERRELFGADRKKWVTAFALTFVPMIACIIVAAAFGSVMFARKDGLNLALTIAFAAAAALLFIASLFTGHKMWAAMKKMSLNEKNSSTALGREYEELQKKAQRLNALYDALN